MAHDDGDVSSATGCGAMVNLVEQSASVQYQRLI